MELIKLSYKTKWIKWKLKLLTASNPCRPGCRLPTSVMPNCWTIGSRTSWNIVCIWVIFLIIVLKYYGRLHILKKEIELSWKFLSPEKIHEKICTYTTWKYLLCSSSLAVVNRGVIINGNWTLIFIKQNSTITSSI